MSKTPEELARKYIDKHILTGTGNVEKIASSKTYDYSVKDRLPEKDTWVLSFQADKSMKDNCLGSDGEWYSDDHGFVPTVTHWMPLPKPPTED